MNRSIQRHPLLFSTVAFLSLFFVLFGGIAQNAGANAMPPAKSTIRPSLIGEYAPAGTGQVTVNGRYFTPGGRVYVALYDQAGQVLYENRWTVASNVETRRGYVQSDGGQVSETYNGLCGAAIMARAYDEGTNAWSSFLDLNSNCAGAAETANGLNSPLKLVVAAPAAYTIATGIVGDPPLLLNSTQKDTGEGAISLTGLDFAAGHKVFIAVYDVMGAKLYPTKWITADTSYKITGMSDTSPEAHPIVSPYPTGTFHETIDGLCGANVLVRAYDATSEAWSNWINVAVACNN